MYIRRKVFSLLEDEMGEMRYFSTNEFTYDGYEDRYFSDEDEHDSAVAKGALIGAGVLGGGAAIGGAGKLGYDLLTNKDYKSAVETYKKGSKAAKKAAEDKIKAYEADYKKRASAVKGKGSKAIKEAIIEQGKKDAVINAKGVNKNLAEELANLKGAKNATRNEILGKSWGNKYVKGAVIGGGTLAALSAAAAAGRASKD